jgi:hypothetical protein
MTAYIPAHKRGKKADEKPKEISLESLSDFPTLGSSASSPRTPTMDFSRFVGAPVVEESPKKKVVLCDILVQSPYNKWLVADLPDELFRHLKKIREAEANPKIVQSFKPPRQLSMEDDDVPIYESATLVDLPPVEEHDEEDEPAEVVRFYEADPRHAIKKNN